MKKLIPFLMAAMVIFSCSKTPVKKVALGGTSSGAFATLFPHIDTATLWQVFWTGSITAKAAVKLDGSLTITSFDTISGGSYKIQLTDSSSGGYPVKSFNLLRAGVDTIISAGNGIALYPAVGSTRAYYWMQIDGGNLPVKAIVRGDFVDSI